ncbi:putative B3 domain-containing protein [Nymphaea thermarum]|nr:putative B3 domain-containing protein [Nymphaea thermarum]
MAPDREDQIPTGYHLLEWMFSNGLRWNPDCAPEDIPRRYQDSSADHQQWSSDTPSLLYVTESHQGISPELQEKDAGVIVYEHLEENHPQSSVQPVETQVPIIAEAASSHPQLQLNIFSPQFASQLNNNNDDGAQQRKQQPVFTEEDLLRKVADLHHCRPYFLFKKRLTISDTNVSQCRLSVPKSAVRANFTRAFFSQEEIDKFGSKNGLEVIAFDQNGEIYAMRFKLWTSCGTYVLLGKWKEFLQNNKLQGTGEEVRIWAIRDSQTSRIVFLITLVLRNSTCSLRDHIFCIVFLPSLSQAMAPDREDQIPAGYHLLEWMFSNGLRWNPDCVPEDIPRRYQDSSADHQQWSSDTPSLLYVTESHQGISPELQKKDAGVIVYEHLEENHPQSSVQLVETQVPIVAEAASSHPQLQLNVFSPQFASQLNNNNDDGAQQRKQQPVFA